MAIEIHDDYIQFGDTKISQTATGISLGSKKLRASNIWEISTAQGTVSGYSSGGTNTPPASPSSLNIIDKFPFSADANATDVGDLTVARAHAAGQSSTTHGYTSGGYTPISNVIDKFPFSTDGNASDVGDLTLARQRIAGQSSSENGYSSGGNTGPGVPYQTNIIDKFPFSADANATDVGDLTTSGRYGSTGQSSSEYGYTSAGFNPPYTNIIDKFPFSVDADATDVGNLTQSRYSPAGQSSTTHGYTSGGGTPYTNIIDKFPFSTDANATDVGDLTLARNGSAGQSSQSHGYSSGGFGDDAGQAFTTIIDKFPFSADANATDVGDVTQARRLAAGQQV